MQSGTHLKNSLSRLSPDIRAVTFDFPGHGKSQACHDSTRFGVQNLIDDLMTWIDALQLSAFFFHGYSMGGRLGWQILKWLLGQDEMIQRRFKGFILESAHPGYFSEQEKMERRLLDESRAEQIEENFELFWNAWERMELFKKPVPVNTNRNFQKSGNGKTDHNHALTSEHDPKSYAACLRGFGNGVLEAVEPDKLHELKIPILLLAGEHDDTYCRINQKMSNSLPSASYSVIPKSGHRCWQDEPFIWSEQVNQFISQHKSP